MAYLEILAPASTVESSVSIALGTATVISASVLTVRMLNDNGTLDTGSSATVALTQQGIGSVIFGSAASTSLTLSSGVATTALRGKYGGVVEFIATASGAGNGGESGGGLPQLRDPRAGHHQSNREFNIRLCRERWRV